MCEFCMKHGEGHKWYLEASNYSEDLLSDLKRQRFIKHFYGDPGSLLSKVKKLELLDKAPWLVKRFVRWRAIRQQKRQHYGQVIPIEDVERILDLTNSVVRVTCICRHLTTGRERRYCYGVSMGPNGGELAKLLGGLNESFISGPDAKGLETLSKEEVLALFAQHEKEGLCHSVWTFGTPFIAGLCNCDRPDCLAMQTTMGHDLPVMFRSEYLAQVDEDLCVGCRACMERCQFGAMGFSAARDTVFIEARACYGCGVCRSACESEAITLHPRQEVPAVAGLW